MRLLLTLPLLWSGHVCAAAALSPSPDEAERRTTTTIPADTLTRRHLESVVVTGTRSPKTLLDTPVPTRLITEDDIRRTDAANIAELLSHELPGLEFTQALSGHTHLNFSGFGGQGVLFLIDGERPAGETMDNVDFSRLDLADVARVEIIKGASSALYGSNAAGGVVNLITRRQIGHPWLLQAESRFGAHSSRRYGLAHGWERSRFTHRFDLRHTDVEGYRLNNPTDVARYTKYAVGEVKGGSTISAKEQFTYRPSSTLSLIGRAGYFFRDRRFDASEDNRYRSFNGGIRGEWTPDATKRLEVSYAFDQYDKSNYYRSTRLDLRNYSNVLHSCKVLYSRTLPGMEATNMTIGTDYARDYLRSYQFADGGAHRRHTADIFLQLDHAPNKKWELVAAGRYDYFSLGNRSHLSGKFSARYRHERLVLRAGYGGGFRAPSLKEHFMYFHINDIFIIRGNTRLRPETSHNLHLTGEYTHGACHFMAGTSYQYVENRITTSIPTTDRDVATGLPFVDYLNLPHLYVWGAEASFRTVKHLHAGRLSARLDYAFVHEQVRDAGTLTPYLPARPHSLTARIDFDRRFSSSYAGSLLLSARFLSSLQGEEYDAVTETLRTITYPAYMLVRLGVMQEIGKALRIHLSADNLLDYRPKIYYYNAPLTTGIALSIGATLDLSRI